MEPVLQINGKEFRKGSSATFEVPWSDLDVVQFSQVPSHSTIDIQGLPGTADGYRLSISATHASSDQFFLHLHVTFTETGDWNAPATVATCSRRLRHIRRFFRPTADDLGLSGRSPDQRQELGGRLYCGVLYSRYFDMSTADFGLCTFLTPFIARFSEFLHSPDLLLFICHASEDKPVVERLCSILDANEIPVWYDRREIKTGDSIVQRVSEGIETASHMVLVISRSSVRKPWVKKEFSAALMRQLQSAAVVLVPLLLDECEIPALIADIKYADCRGSIEAGVAQMLGDIVGSGARAW